MDSLINSGCNVEITAPAGNFEKLNLAVHFGADSVYFGGQQFNLRAKSTNFNISELEQAVDFCKKHNTRSVLLLNAFLHEGDLSAAKKYITEISKFKFDAIMISDPGMLMLLRDADIESNVHISTQMSTLNHYSVKFWQDAGIKRIVLAREVTLEEVRQIRKHTDIELEIFAHGALCMSYSGRCLLSRYLSGRDANQGSCSHPCRWKYSLVEEKREGSHLDIIEHSSGTEILSSKDLCLIAKLPAYIEAGVNSFKIEGRMKSLYYTSNVTRIYKHALETYLNKGPFEQYIKFWEDELDLISHRPYTDDLFNEFDNMGFTKLPYIKKVLFLGYNISSDEETSTAEVKIFNPVYLDEEIEAIYPIKNNSVIDTSYRIIEIRYEDKLVDMAQPGKTCQIKFDKPVFENAIFRRRIT